MSRMLACTLTTALAAAMPAYAQTADQPVSSELETLRAELAARQAINEQLSRRIETLEQQLAAHTRDDKPVMASLDAGLPKPPADLPQPGAVTAAGEALVSKGLVLMPEGSLRVTPGASWVHSGTGASRADSYAASLTMETGLPWGMAAAVSVPYIWRDYASGRNNGVGDPSISLAKKLNDESVTLPSVVLRLSYTVDGGRDPFVLPSIGSGFRSAGVSLLALKRLDPIFLYGSLSYSHGWSKLATISDKSTGAILFQGRITPGDAWGVDMGASLAVTPDIALDAGLSFLFADSARFDQFNSYSLPGRATAGYINLGASMLLTRNLSMSMGASAGVTKDASDLVFSVAFPYKF